ncbi:hypothetical protein C0Q92_13545 [Streptomyces albidoflavus]|uniref:Uncharacterized protein n=1 Tax=Streptomyces albidoflavus TaxID=1886 RepID=A0A8G2E3B7_9ACTN|nr:hypothetical protein C0Q92_13545 [Streptomyces albidoflavus]
MPPGETRSPRSRFARRPGLRARGSRRWPRRRTVRFSRPDCFSWRSTNPTPRFGRSVPFSAFCHDLPVQTGGRRVRGKSRSAHRAYAGKVPTRRRSGPPGAGFRPS